MNEDQFLEELIIIYRDSQIYDCDKCHHQDKYPWNDMPCQEILVNGNTCDGKLFHVGELGKSVQGSFQWYIARAKGEKV